MIYLWESLAGGTCCSWPWGGGLEEHPGRAGFTLLHRFQQCKVTELGWAFISSLRQIACKWSTFVLISSRTEGGSLALVVSPCSEAPDPRGAWECEQLWELFPASQSAGCCCFRQHEWVWSTFPAAKKRGIASHLLLQGLRQQLFLVFSWKLPREEPLLVKILVFLILFNLWGMCFM